MRRFQPLEEHAEEASDAARGQEHVRSRSGSPPEWREAEDQLGELGMRARYVELMKQATALADDLVDNVVG